MLDLKNNYLDFGAQLQPPAGYEIDYAVATTYTLDLYALLTVPLALFYKISLESKINNDNFQVLESIQNLHRHFKIYCHEGKISVPKDSGSRLLAFVESCVHGIKPKEVKQSFHPKVWVLRFKASMGEDVLYRAIVMSRNLTFDRSYDIAYTMEGKPQRRKNTKNDELIRMVKWLDKQVSIPHKKFIDDLEKVDFKLCDNFTDYSFQFFPKKEAKDMIQFFETFERRMVVSPFLAKLPVAELQENTQDKLVLFSRKTELDKLSEKDLEGLEPYYFNEQIVEGNNYEKLEEGNEEEDLQRDWDNNLHAKIYINEIENRKYWHLGSANCSNAAFKNNYEFMLSLETEVCGLGVNAINDELIKEYNGVSVFQRYERIAQESITVPEEHDFREIEFAILNALDKSDFNAYLRDGKLTGTYDLNIFINLRGEFIDKYNISIRPFGQKVYQKLRKGDNNVRFEIISTHQLSQFLEWKIKHKKSQEITSMVLLIAIENLPEKRLSSILKTIIDNPSKFMLLIQALLSNEPVANTSDVLPKINNRLSNKAIQLPNMTLSVPIYEDLLIALSREPGKIRRLKTIIDQLKASEDTEALITEEFSQLWEMIKQFLPNE